MEFFMLISTTEMERTGLKGQAEREGGNKRKTNGGLKGYTGKDRQKREDGERVVEKCLSEKEAFVFISSSLVSNLLVELKQPKLAVVELGSVRYFYVSEDLKMRFTSLHTLLGY